MRFKNLYSLPDIYLLFKIFFSNVNWCKFQSQRGQKEMCAGLIEREVGVGWGVFWKSSTAVSETSESFLRNTITEPSEICIEGIYYQSIHSSVGAFWQFSLWEAEQDSACMEATHFLPWHKWASFYFAFASTILPSSTNFLTFLFKEKWLNCSEPPTSLDCPHCLS